MPNSSSARESKRTSQSSRTSTSGTHKSSSDRREKAKSNQVYDERRRGSQQVSSGLKVSAERPELKGRTNSAPLVQSVSEPVPLEARQAEDDIHIPDLDPAEAAVVLGAAEVEQDDDEVAGVVGAIKHFEPFRNELSEPLPDINVAVIGAEGVGKSTFMQNALSLPFPSDSQAVERKIGIDGNDYLLRLLEISIDDVEIDDDDSVSWPETIEERILPHIDGALTLYNVKDQSSLESIPEMLTAINKSGIPSILVSCKCDTPPEERDVNPRVIEQTARRKVKDLDTLQVSTSAPESHQQGITMILRAIVSNTPKHALEDRQRSPSPSRQRAQTSAVAPSSPRPPSDRGHSRASSEHTGTLQKNQWHTKHDSKLAAYNSSDRLKALDESNEDMHGSFLIERSDTETSDTSSEASEEAPETRFEGDAKVSLISHEEGYTIDALADKLLAQPMSKADDKFAAIFLALYRKFAAPGRLLEAIVQRFDDLERSNSATMIKTINQLRYLCIIEQWIATYPGDFAHSKTLRRMRTFASKLSEIRMFGVAAKEIKAHIETVREDDDTNWEYCDRDRPSSSGSGFEAPMSDTASTLIDDPAILDAFLMGPTPMEDDSKFLGGAEDDSARSMSSSSLLSQHTATVEMAQKQANLLQPIPRHLLSKVQWRALMDFPNDVVARELTRIDWIMFCSIRPRDLVRQVSLTEEQKAECKNLAYVNRMIEHFNDVAFWVTNYILIRDKPKHRALMLEKFMRIARKLREMNNYNALGAVIAGVKSTAVHRLAATRELIPPAIGKDWLKLEVLMAPSRSHSAYRLAWENSSTERIPYLPLHRRDLVSAEEGNKTFIGDDKDAKVNWKKFEIMGDVIVSMQKAQGVPYKSLGSIRGNEQLKELMLDVKLVKDEDVRCLVAGIEEIAANANDQKDLFARSKQLEPSGTPAIGTTAKFKELFKRWEGTS